MRYFKIAIFIIVMFNFLQTSKGQNTNAGSPYSRFGLGDMQPNTFAINRGMAGLGVAMQSPFNLNPVNPAANSLLNRTAIEVGIGGTVHYLRTSNAHATRSNANLTNFSLGFPIIKNKWGGGILLMPVSTLGYEIQNTVNNNLGSSHIEGYRGTGGLNEFAITNGLRISKKTSIGVKASYLFGSINQERIFRFPDSLLAYHVRISEDIRLADFAFNFGIQRRDTLRLDTAKMAYRILLTGITFNAPYQMNAVRDFVVARYTQFEGGAPRIRDTINNDLDNKGSIQMPFSIGAGATIVSNKWTLGMEGSYQNWQNFRSFSLADTLKNSFSLAVGAQYLPNDEVVFNKKNYWKKVRYRAGFRFQNAFLELNNQPINTFGMTFGISLPKNVDRTSFGSYDFSIEYLTRGTTNANLIKDNFIRFTFGVTLNDLWFRRYKYD